jgi:hypothetical protein
MFDFIFILNDLRNEYVRERMLSLVLRFSFLLSRLELIGFGMILLLFDRSQMVFGHLTQEQIDHVVIVEYLF